ncbi:hypothetical protein JCM11251_003285 [Rhodosporidiobolus azoricus]
MAHSRASLAESGENTSFVAHPSTGLTTRSMSRRSLAGGVSSVRELEGDMQPPSRTITSTAARIPRSRTINDDSSTSSSLSRNRTPGTLSRPTLTSKAVAGVPASTRPRRVLADHNTASTGSLNSANRGVRSPPKRGRLSRAEAGQMTGMGIVRAGPAVQGRSGQMALPRATSSSAATVDSVSDPFSTAFVRPTFDFEISAERGSRAAGMDQIRVVKPLPSDEVVENRRRKVSGEYDGDRMDAEDHEDFRMPAPTAINPFDLTSPKKKRPVATAPRSPQRVPHSAGDEKPVLQLVDLNPTSAAFLPIPPFSPNRGALSPRTLTGKTSSLVTVATGTVRRKLADIESSSEEDELDFLSPRKKPRQIAPSPVAHKPGPSAFPPRQPPQPAGLRSPPPKKKLPSSAKIHAPVHAGPRPPVPSTQREPASAAMQRTSGRAFPLPDLTSLPIPPIPTSKLPRSQPLSSLSSSTAAPTPPSALAHFAPTASEVTNRILPSSLTGPNQAPKLARSTRSSTGLSSIARPAALPVTASSTASGSSSRLPRPAARVIPPPPPPHVSPALPAMAANGSMALDAPSSANVADLSIASVSTVTSTKSEETARRLANLQSMLSRLQMPASRRTSGGSDASMSMSMSMISAPMARDYEVPTAPPAEEGPSRRSSHPRGQTRISSGNIASASTTVAAAGGARRRSSVAVRGPGGIVNTSTALASASFSGAPSISSASAPNLGGSVTRRTSSGYSNSSFSFDTSLIAEASGLGEQQHGGGKSMALRGVSAFVDVRTAEGDDSSMIFTDMLRSMGARVTTRPSSLTTHIIYKSGRPSTLHFFRTLAPARRPHLVGIAWVVRCAEVGSHVDEASFKIDDVEGEKENRGIAKGQSRTSAAGEVKTGEKREIGAMAQAALGLSSGTGAKGAGPNKRRRSMEPKALAALNNSMSAPASADNALKASIAASIERARRKSLLYAPKVGSPLAKRVFVMPDAPSTEEMDEDE